MQILFYLWPEILITLGVSALMLFMAQRRQKKLAAKAALQPPPSTFFGKLLIGLKITLRLVAFGVGAFLLIAISIAIYRNIIGLQTETAPAPSQVEIPAGLPFAVEEVTFMSEDGLRIAGWFISPQNGATVILLHGYGGNRTHMLWHADKLVKAGYGVLMYDERASGESEGTYRSYGWEDSRDVGGALAFLNQRPDVDPEKIGIGGCSTGGQIALQGAAYYPQIGAVWADGASTIRASDIPPVHNPIAAIIVGANYMLDWMYQVKLDIEPPLPLTEIIGEIAPRPIMLIGGGTPMVFIGSEGDVQKYYADIAGPNAEVWVIPEATHCDGPAQRPDEYARQMVEFFDKAFDR